MALTLLCPRRLLQETAKLDKAYLICEVTRNRQTSLVACVSWIMICVTWTRSDVGLWARDQPETSFGLAQARPNDNYVAWTLPVLLTPLLSPETAQTPAFIQPLPLGVGSSYTSKKVFVSKKKKKKMTNHAQTLEFKVFAWFITGADHRFCSIFIIKRIFPIVF